jgi:opacity protein-like surface antigen
LNLRIERATVRVRFSPKKPNEGMTMKRILVAAIAAVMSIAQASGADVYDGRLDAGADQPTPVYFQGLAVGVHGGGQFTAIDITDDGFAFDGISADGLVGGAGIEYLFPFGNLRVGPYVEGGFSNVNTEINGADLLRQDHYYGGGLKAGFVAFDSSLVYARAGYEWALWKTDADDSIDIDAEAFVIGGGVETMIGSHVSIGLGADYLVPNNVTADDIDVTSFVEDSESLRVLGRLTWRQ